VFISRELYINKNAAHLEKCGTLEKSAAHLEKCATLETMRHTWKNAAHFDFDLLRLDFQRL